MDLHHIAEGLRPLAVPIASLVLDPDNARTHGAANLAAIRASFARFGQVKPLAARRVRPRRDRRQRPPGLVAREMGWSHVAVVLMDGTPAELAAFALADNKTAELAEWDDGALAALLQTAAPEADLAALGFDGRELATLLDAEEAAAPPQEDADAPPPVEPEAAPPPAPQPAKGAKAKAQQRAVAGTPTIAPDTWRLLTEAARALRVEYQDDDLTMDEALRIMARRAFDRRPPMR